MPLIRFTQVIQRHVECPDEQVPGATVRDVLEAYCRRHARVRGYVVDERGALRPHMVVFVDGRQVTDRQTLGDEVTADGVVDVMQALSGG